MRELPIFFRSKFVKNSPIKETLLRMLMNF
jgi:hypothetical protein